MPDLSGLSDQELADRYGRVDLKLREMLNWSPLMDQYDALLAAIREEMDARRKKANGNGK
jgi:hypothetical protein